MTRMLEGHAAFITGAGRGIGRAVAIMLAGEGCDVALIARNADELGETRRLCEAAGATAIALPLDLSDVAALASAVEQIASRFNGLNLLINNAGMHQFSSSAEADLNAWDAMLDVNLRAVMHATGRALPHIIDGTKRGKRGACIFISSLGGKFSAPTNAGYAATKHALTGFGGSVFEDVRDHGIKVCTVYPGWVNTGMLADWLQPSDAIQPEDVAEAVRYVVASPGTVCPTEIVLQPHSSKAARLLN